MTRALVKSFYALFGVLYLAAGLSVLLLGTGLLPTPIRKLILDIGQGNDNTLHVMQEFGCLLVFAGLITLWFVRHYEQSGTFHWAMTAFWALFALVHWVDVRGRPAESFLGPAINTVPFALFLAVGLLRRRAPHTSV
jgi:uncharacterized protein YjeT (DUF2065 family)